MQEDTYRLISELLESHDPEDLRRGLNLVSVETASASDADARRLCELIVPLFYIDTLDHPEHMPAVETAIIVTADMGDAVIPVLIETLESGDVKAQMALAQALGWMGAKAVDPLIAEYAQTCPDPACRAFLLYALGKIKSPEIVKAIPLALEAARSPDQELRDTATRALGKFAESIPPGSLDAEARLECVDVLQANLSDVSPSVRAKAVRSLGKLARHGHLTPGEQAQLRGILRRLLGEDEHFEWDRAYVVRKEAKEALDYV
jgi:HEAT repeat protein